MRTPKDLHTLFFTDIISALVIEPVHAWKKDGRSLVEFAHDLSAELVNRVESECRIESHRMSEKSYQILKDE